MSWNWIKATKIHFFSKFYYMAMENKEESSRGHCKIVKDQKTKNMAEIKVGLNLNIDLQVYWIKHSRPSIICIIINWPSKAKS